jgi:hypothetical protein
MMPAAIWILTVAMGFTSPTWRSHGSKANFSIAQCNEKRSDQPPTAWRPVAKARFRGGGNRTRVYITDPKKNCLAGFATIERILR